MQLYSLCVSQSFEKSLFPDIIEMKKIESNDLITNIDFKFEDRCKCKFENGIFMSLHSQLQFASNFQEMCLTNISYGGKKKPYVFGLKQYISGKMFKNLHFGLSF